MTIRIACVVAALALVACGASTTNESAEQPAPSPDTPTANEAPPPSEQPTSEAPTVRQSEMWAGRSAPDPSSVTCSADADCATIEIGCCDHCNGGTLAAVRADHAAEVRAAQTASCEPTTACTERACAGGRAVCVDGECAYVAMWRGGAPAP